MTQLAQGGHSSPIDPADVSSAIISWRVWQEVLLSSSKGTDFYSLTSSSPMLQENCQMILNEGQLTPFSKCKWTELQDVIQTKLSGVEYKGWKLAYGWKLRVRVCWCLHCKVDLPLLVSVICPQKKLFNWLLTLNFHIKLLSVYQSAFGSAIKLKSLIIVLWISELNSGRKCDFSHFFQYCFSLELEFTIIKIVGLCQWL